MLLLFDVPAYAALNGEDGRSSKEKKSSDVIAYSGAYACRIFFYYDIQRRDDSFDVYCNCTRVAF